MKKERRRFTPAFKSKVALEALCEDGTIRRSLLDCFRHEAKRTNLHTENRAHQNSRPKRSMTRRGKR